MGRHAEKRRRIAGLLLALCVPVMLAGCYGHFPLTRAVYKYNGEVSDDKFVKSLVFWGFIIIPVYSAATFADAVIFNLFEFWTGERLMETASVGEGAHIAVVPGETPDTARLILTRKGRALPARRVVRLSDRVLEIRDGSGRLLGHLIRTADGGVRLINADGEVLRTIPAREVAARLAG